MTLTTRSTRPVWKTGTGILPGLPAIAPPKRQWSVLVWLSYTWIVLVVLLAVFARVLPLPAIDAIVGAPRQAPQFGELDTLLGTDSAGRSMLTRMVYGGQISLLIGTASAAGGVVLGTILGLLAGYYRKSIDWVVTLVADVLLSFPSLVLLLAITAIFSPSVPVLLIGLGLTSTPTFIRLARASTMSWTSREFVRAARNMGASNVRILLREILPNVTPTLAAYLPLVIAALIVAEGSLSFLGLGVPPPTPSWGGMINAGAAELRSAPYMVFVPAVALFLTVFALNQAGENLRMRFDRTMRD
ncbi:ABC transporter permease [Arthrobacter sunyaminii]|uniref:ABC transporter permease n=1 Tax=Arthrobacter sunyaminii TaxID=2816859 RepID=A0A975S697_9MICC|nr:ABC transporter permease [Arthrobacter sunyaminii]MBO0909812.1 ABC transporter permease [Arthrobacter sunyaminii]QWQ36602.1 ABC transporter permease [Arthrobacter sunyaminii]